MEGDKRSTSMLRNHLSWKGRVPSFLCKQNETIKPIITIMLWHFATKLALFFMALVFVQLEEPNVLVTNFVAIIYIFSPLAGFLADTKYGRLEVLQCSTCFMLVAVVLSLVSITFLYAVHSLNYYFYLLFVPFAAAQVILTCGNAMYLATILQFGTDQLRELPSSYTVLMLYAYYWSDNLGSLLTIGVNVPGHEMIFDPRKGAIQFDGLQNILVEIVLCISAILLIAVLFLLRRKQDWITTGGTSGNGGNPYRLVYNVVRFALRHKHLIRRSAFTYCEDEYPSRLDFGKQRYGGPFTTEQVEDVKVLLNMVKVLFSAGSLFLMDVASKVSILVPYHSSYKRYDDYRYPVKILFLDYGMMSPFLAVTCIPLYICLVKPLLLRCSLNVFKRMGLSLVLQISAFLLFLLYNSVACDHNIDREHIFLRCRGETDLLSNNLVSISGVYLLVLYNILAFLYQMMFSIASWEFICSQSPQHMKGVLFGLFYAIRGLHQLLAVIMSLLVFYYWNSTVINCQSGYNILHVAIGLCSLAVFTVISRNYQYRKRDDICNVYQYAEDYYSNS